MPSEFAKKAIAYGVAAAVGAGAYVIYDALTGGDEEERPPIIVQNGSVEINVEYPDETYGSKGSWQPQGSSGRYRHDHTLSGPNRMRNSVFNGTCVGGAWRNGGLRITYTNGTTDWTVEVSVQGNKVQVDGMGQTVTTYPADPSRLTVTPTVGGASWIKAVDPLAGGAGCTFNQNSNPVIRMEQKR